MKDILVSLIIIACLAVVGVMVFYQVQVYAILLFLALVAAGFVFYFNILPHIEAARQTLDIPGRVEEAKASGLSTLWLRLTGFKAQISILLSIGCEAFPQLVGKLDGFDFSSAFGPKIGTILSLVFMVLAAYFHAIGIRDAAAADPSR